MANGNRINAQTRLGCPKQPYIFGREDQTVFFSRETFTGVRVNRSGRVVLEAMRKDDTPLLLADRLAQKYQVSAAKILNKLLSFLQAMVDAGYLWLADPPVPISKDFYDTSFRPIQMYLHLTHVCNLSCVYCYNKHYRQHVKAPELSLSELIKILEEGTELGIREVVFTGGEPLLRQEVFDLAAYGQKLGMRVCLTTNGTLITQRGADVVATAFDSIFVSLDSCRQPHHDRLRGVGSYQQVVEGVRQLCARKPDKVCLRPVITRHNIESLPEFPVWAAGELGCKLILPTLYLPNSFTELQELHLLPDMEKFRCALKSFEAASKKVGVTNVLDCLSFRSRGKCGAGSQIISVDATGQVFPCQALHFPELSCGNIRKNKLNEIGQALSMRRFAELSLNSIFKCRDCELGPVCGGGCRALAYALYRDIYAYNEFFCPILRKEAEDRLWAESEKSRRAPLSPTLTPR